MTADLLIDETVFGPGAVFAERSVKLTQRGAQVDRMLYGIRRAGVPGLRGRVMALARVLGLPTDELELRFGEALMVHVGIEGRADPVYKLYLEFAQPPADLPGLRFVAWKAQGGRIVRSTYTRTKTCDLPPPMDGMMAELMTKTPGPLLRVEEPGTDRHSYDLNLYDAGLTLGDVMPTLSPMLKTLHHDTIPVFGPDARLGHVSVGTGRDGAPFLTIYADAELREVTV